MKRSKIFAGIFLLLLLKALLSGCVRPQNYSQEDLIRHHALSVEGEVIKQSRGSFILKDDQGADIILRTGELTQYIPPDYRSLQGDRVSVTYKEVWGKADKPKFAVLQLKPIHVPEKNNPLPNQIEGEIESVRRGSYLYMKCLYMKVSEKQEAVPVYIEKETKTLFNGKAYPASKVKWDKSAGLKVKMRIERIPILRGNAYIYVAREISITIAEGPEKS